MTIPFEIQTEEDVPIEEVSEIIQETFAYVDNHYNKFNPHSELSLINSSPAKQPLPITEGLYTLLKETQRVWELTNGLFDPTVEPVAKLWKMQIQEGIVPSQEALESKRTSIGWNQVHFDKTSITKDDDALEIDLGGIAKGYTVDLLYERLKQKNIRHIYVEWGGEIRVSKEHPAIRPWRIALHSSESDQLAFLELSDQACATSGDYEQTWTLKDHDGQSKRFFHILNPLTLRLLEANGSKAKSYTVVAPTCTLADGIATSLFFFQGKDKEAYQTKLQQALPSIQIFESSNL